MTKYIFDTHADAAKMLNMLVAMFKLDLNDEQIVDYAVRDVRFIKTTPSGMSEYSDGFKLIKFKSIFTGGPR